MTLTTSSNRSLLEFRQTYRWAMKKSVGMMALLALLIFIAFPMILMIGMSNTQNNTSEILTAAHWMRTYTRYISMICLLLTPLILIFAVITSVLQFNYLHQKRSVDLFHALPIGRVPMLLGRYCTALTTLFLPILLNFAIVSIVGFCYRIDVRYCFSSIAIEMLWMMLMSTAALTFCLFMAVCTGTTFDMVISVLGINVAYPLLVYVTSEFASRLLPGLKIELSLSSTALTALSPFAAAFLPLLNSVEISSNGFMGLDDVLGGFLIWWIFFTLALLAGSILLYRKRKSECAESSFAFPIPKIIIRFIVTAVAGLGFGLLLQTATSAPTNYTNFYIGVISGSLAAHIVVEAVYSRGFQHMKKSFVSYGIFAAAFLVLYGVLATGCFGYDTHLPNADQVESISVSVSGNYIKDETIYDNELNRVITKISPVLKDQANIGKVLELHKALVADKRKTSFPYSMDNTEYPNLTLAYHLKNGSTLKRSYSYKQTNSETVEPKSKLQDMIETITQMNEFRTTSSILFYLEPEYIKSIDIYSNASKSKETPIIPDITAKKELLEALKQDYLNGKIDNPNSNEEDTFGIAINFEDPITLKDGKLKTLLGGFSGKILISGNNYLNLTNSADKTKAVIQKYNWNK